MMEITSKSMLHLSTVSRLFDNVSLYRVYIEGYSIIICKCESHDDICDDIVEWDCFKNYFFEMYLSY